MGVRKLLGLLCVLCIAFSLTVCAKDGARRRRREACEEGTYNLSTGLTCCRCPAGYYLKSDCSTNLGFPTCDLCEDGTFMNHASSETRCVPCKECENNANLVVKKRCMPSSDTECTCKEGYYCDKESCKACHACDTCEGLEVKVKCSATNNTVCVPKETANVAAIVGSVLAVVGVGAAVLLILYFKRKNFFGNKSSHTQSEEEEQLEDVDLREYLQDISNVLGLRTVRKLTRRKLSSVRIQNIEDESQNNADEQAYKMLEAWYEMHGMQGAYSHLINYLKQEGKSKAEDVQKIVKQGQNPNSGAAGNGVV